MSKIFLSAPDISGKEVEYVLDVFKSNYVAPAGPMLDRFEKDMCNYTGFEHAIAVSSGTAALHLALQIVGVGPGDTVWTTSMTFVGGVSPIVYLGATPVFFDMRESDWSLDCDLIEAELEKASRDGNLPSAIVPTDLYGQCCDLKRIVDAAAQYDVPVICDGAESLGAHRDGTHSGKGAKASIMSFNGNKIISTSGGGMLLSDDGELVAKARYLSTQARQDVLHYEHTEIGYNYRLSNICAAIGVGQLQCIEDKVEAKRNIFNRYTEKLNGASPLVFMPEPTECRSTRWLSCALIEGDDAQTVRDNIIQHCAQHDIETRPLWKPMHLQPVFKGSTFIGSGICERFFDTGLCLPSGCSMTEPDQDRVIACIARAVSSGVK